MKKKPFSYSRGFFLMVRYRDCSIVSVCHASVRTWVWIPKTYLCTAVYICDPSTGEAQTDGFRVLFLAHIYTGRHTTSCITSSRGSCAFFRLPPTPVHMRIYTHTHFKLKTSGEPLYTHAYKYTHPQVVVLCGQSGQPQMYKKIILGTQSFFSRNGPSMVVEFSNPDLGRGGVWRQSSGFTSRGIIAWISLEFSNCLCIVFTSK